MLPRFSATNMHAVPHPAGVISSGVRCIRCGYPLRGLDHGGGCPECGARVAMSVEWWSRYGDLTPQGLRACCRGAAWLVVAGLVGLAGSGVSLVLWVFSLRLMLMSATWTLLLVMVAFMPGVWWFTSALGRAEGANQRNMRWAARCMGLLVPIAFIAHRVYLSRVSSISVVRLTDLLLLVLLPPATGALILVGGGLSRHLVRLRRAVGTTRSTRHYPALVKAEIVTLIIYAVRAPFGPGPAGLEPHFLSQLLLLGVPVWLLAATTSAALFWWELRKVVRSVEGSA